MMPMSGPHMAQMPYHPPPPQWFQHQQNMMMASGWPPAGQPHMYAQHGLMSGGMPMPVSTMMGGLGPAPPSQPPPPLPAEPPPTSPNTVKVLPPPPPPSSSKDTSPQQSEKKTSKWDQPNKIPTSSAESAVTSNQPRPPNSSAPVQPKPPQSPLSVQTRPQQSSTPVQVKSAESPAAGQVNLSHGPPAGQVNPTKAPAPSQVHLEPSTDQVNSGQPTAQVSPGLPTGQVNSGPPTGQVNPSHGPLTGQYNNTRFPETDQVNPSQGLHASHFNIFHGPPMGQGNTFHEPPMGQGNTFHGPPMGGQGNTFHGPPTGQGNTYHGPPTGQGNTYHGPPTGQINPFHGPPMGQGNTFYGHPSHQGNTLYEPPMDQVSPSQGPPAGQVNNVQGLVPNHGNPSESPAAGQPILADGQTTPNLMKVTHGTSLGNAQIPSVVSASDQSAHTGTTVTDPLLMAELEKVNVEEALFLEQFKQWKQQYDDWREQNQNHPNKEQFQQYLEQWKTYEQQMEVRRQGIQTQKQKVEEKLSQMSTPEISKLGEHRQIGDMTNRSWDTDSNHADVREHNNVQFQQQIAGHSDASFPYRYPSTGVVEPPGSANQFSGTAGQQPKDVHVLHKDGEDDKGEEDMNLDEDEESGGIIESGQHVGGNAWQGKVMTDSYKHQSAGDWNLRKQKQEDQSHHTQWSSVQGGDNLAGTENAEPARDWSSQRGGSQRGIQRPVVSRGRGHGNSGVTSGLMRPSFDNDETDIDTDFRVAKSADVAVFVGDDNDECGDDEHYGEFNYGISGVDNFQNTSRQESFAAGRGQLPTGRESDFPRGRGEEFLRGRGGEFLRGRGGDFLRSGGGEFPKGSGGEFMRGRGGDFLRGRGGEFLTDRASEFLGGRGGEFMRGRGGEVMRGRGGEFMRGRGGEFMRGRGGEFMRGRGGEFMMDRDGEFQVDIDDFHRARGGIFQRGRGGVWERGRGRGHQFPNSSDFPSEDAEVIHSLDSEDCEGIGGASRGRGRLPSLLGFEFKDTVRHRFSDFEPARAEQDPDYEDRVDSQAEVIERQRYYLDDDDDEQDGRLSFPPIGRGGMGRGGEDHGHGRTGLRNTAGFRNEYPERDNQRELGSAQRVQGGMTLRGGLERLPQTGRGAGRREYEMANVFKKSGESFHLRDNYVGDMRSQEVDPEVSANELMWDDEPEESLLQHYDRPRNQLIGDNTTGNDQFANRGRGRRIPDEDEPEVKKVRLSRETDESRLKTLPLGDPSRLPTDRKPYPDPYVRGPYLDPHSGWPPYSLDRPVLDRFSSAKSSVYELARDRKVVPATIDYGHGGVDRDRTVSKPAEVIDYGHGQSGDSQQPLDSSRTDGLRGGSEMRSGREVSDLTRVSDLRDRDINLRRTDISSRTTDLPRYGIRRDQKVFDGAGSETGPNSFRGWLADSNDTNFDIDRPSLMRDRSHLEDVHPRGHRTARYLPRDEAWKSSDRATDESKLFANREDDRSTFRDTGPSRGVLDYSEKDDYYNRRDALYKSSSSNSRLKSTYLDRGTDYTQDRDDSTIADDTMAARDSRYGSSTGDVYSRDDSRAGGEHGRDRDSDRYSRTLSPTTSNSTTVRAPSPPAAAQIKAEIVKVEDLLCPPNRQNRPAQIVTIIRGLPGSGKTYVSKLLREKEISCGGAAPRMLCLDDYFMVESERDVVDQDTGKKVKKRVMEYEYEQAMEETYRQSLLKSFKKTVDDGFYPFIIVDATNERVAHFSEFWSYAKSKGFQVYVGELNVDVSTCIQRNIHHWTEWDIEKVKNNWEPLPSHYIRMDLRWLLQEDSIPEVIMEDLPADENNDADAKNADEEEEESELSEVNTKSRWELDTSMDTLDKLDGIRVSKKHIAEHQSLNDYLQLDQMDDDYFSRESLPGQKRVRWADLEEKKTQSRRRNLGFIVGQTQQDWQRITDNDFASKALNQTKYFYKN